MIKLNMNLPKNCWECKFGLPCYEVIACGLTGKYNDKYKRRPTECPINRNDVIITDKLVRDIYRDVYDYDCEGVIEGC